MYNFTAELDIIGINPFVYVPEDILLKIFEESKKEKGHIPVSGIVKNKAFSQTLVKYKGEWRLYINMKMLPNSPKRIGEKIEISIGFDNSDKNIKINPKLEKALTENKQAKIIFETLSPSRQKEIIRYISFLKTEESINKNIEKAIGFLLGKNRFVGREKP